MNGVQVKEEKEHFLQRVQQGGHTQKEAEIGMTLEEQGAARMKARIGGGVGALDGCHSLRLERVEGCTGQR